MDWVALATFTVIVFEAALYWAVSAAVIVIFAVPPAFAVTLPSVSTVAMAVLEDSYVRSPTFPETLIVPVSG